jgi:N-acyl-L-homoserine lactone synthetase
MQHTRPASNQSASMLTFPDLVSPAEQRNEPPRQAAIVAVLKVADHEAEPRPGHVKASVLSFLNMHDHGDLLVSFLRARKKTFIDRLNWQLPESDGMEYDQYDTPASRWIVIHEFGEVVGGIRITPTTARCGIYSYMLRDAQKGLLDEIPSDVLFFEAPVSPSIWEASRLFISQDVPSHRRVMIQSVLMETLSKAARELGASQVIGIVPAVWSRWLRRLDLGAVPVGPKFAIDGSISQAALFNTSFRRF